MEQANQRIHRQNEVLVSPRVLEEQKEALRNREVVVNQIRIWYEYFLLCGIFLVMVRTALGGSTPEVVPFALLLVYEWTWILRLSYQLIRPVNTIDSKFFKFELCISYFTAVFYAMLLMNKIGIPINLLFIGIPIHLSNFTTLGFRVKYKYKCKEFGYRTECIYRWVLGVTSLFCGLKDIDLIKWNWFFIFWPIWLLVVALAMIGIGKIIHVGKIIYRSIKRNGQCIESIFPMIMIYFFIGTAFCIADLFYQLSTSLDSGELDPVLSSIIMSLIYFIGLFVFTILFYPIIL